jgi:hypothetical protein
MKKNISRREALHWIAITVAASLSACRRIGQITKDKNQLSSTQTATHSSVSTSTSQPEIEQEMNTKGNLNIPKVFMIKSISADGLMRIYEALDKNISGNVAIKISSGEPGGHYFLSPDLILPLVGTVNGTIVECNTAYGGKRAETTSHRHVMEDHGFTTIAPTDIMDADGTISIPISGGTHLVEDIVGSHFSNYDFVINLAHFKGHAMGGFGGVIKNMSIGIASQQGKCLIHTAGASSTSIWGEDQDDFLESMAEAAKGVADYMKGNILHIDVMNNLSVDCDCDSSPAAPTMQDIGILASLDPVAVDQACVDLVYAAPDGKDLIERIESRNAIHTLEHGEAIGLGSRKYELIDID